MRKQPWLRLPKAEFVDENVEQTILVQSVSKKPTLGLNVICTIQRFSQSFKISIVFNRFWQLANMTARSCMSMRKKMKAKI